MPKKVFSETQRLCAEGMEKLWCKSPGHRTHTLCYVARQSLHSTSVLSYSSSISSTTQISSLEKNTFSTSTSLAVAKPRTTKSRRKGDCKHSSEKLAPRASRLPLPLFRIDPQNLTWKQRTSQYKLSMCDSQRISQLRKDLR